MTTSPSDHPRDNLGRLLHSAEMLDEIRGAISLAYGHLWHIETDDRRIHRARRLLLRWLTSEEQGLGIFNARIDIDDSAQGGRPPASEGLTGLTTSGDPAAENSTETCSVCKHCRGPVVLFCVNDQSEFFKCLIDAEGYCPEFSR